MDRDGNLPGFIRFSDESGSRLEGKRATLKPSGGFGLTLVTAKVFQARAVSIAAKG